MYNNNISPTPYWPFDSTPLVASIPIKDKTGASLTGGLNGPCLTPEGAFELCFNTKSMLLKTGSYVIASIVDNSAYGSFPDTVFQVLRYTIDNSDKPIRFGSIPQVGSQTIALSFSIDFTLGKNRLGTSAGNKGHAYFTPISQFYIHGTLPAGSQRVSYWLEGSPGISTVYTSFDFSGFKDITSSAEANFNVVLLDPGGTNIDFTYSYPQTSPALIATEKIDDIYFTPTNIVGTVASTITLTCPATKYAKDNGYDTPIYRPGFKYLTKIFMEGLANPITQTKHGTDPYFTLQLGSSGVKDIAVITLPVNSGVKSGRIGMEFSNAYNTNSGGNNYDYFETISKLMVT